MARDADETRRRIFDAATIEFGTHGIAGARIDRIAEAACANKQLIYAYFGGKRQLFEAVFLSHLAHLLDNVPLDPENLPGYAGALFDYYVERPELARLVAWHGLDPEEAGHRIPAIDSAVRSRGAAVARAQRAGTVSDAIPARELVAMISRLASLWIVGAPELTPPGGETPRVLRRQRAAVVEAVRRLVEPR
jgi:AcrR family transcriptional regulator